MSNDVYKLEPANVDGIICNFYEHPEMQCIVVEDGIRCNHGVRNKMRQLCSAHYARFQRNGHTGVARKTLKAIHAHDGHPPAIIRPTKAVVETHSRLVRDGKSVVCFCAHPFLNHKLKGVCSYAGCKCMQFSGTDANTLYATLHRMEIIGFNNPINDMAYCLRCQDFIVVGHWHDNYVINRMREHLKIKHISKGGLSPLAATG